MGFFKRVVDVVSMRSEKPVRRLVAYYVALCAILAVSSYFVPVVDRLFFGEQLERMLSTPQLLEDGLATPTTTAAQPADLVIPRLEFSLTIILAFLGTMAFMLPVSWVYMFAKKDRTHNQSVAQTLIILPLVVAGVVLVVQNSLALAFSLAGVVAAVRFRTTLSDTRDVVFIFLAIAIGFAAGVQALLVAAILSMLFNAVVLLVWRFDFAHNVLAPTASSQWAEPLNDLSGDPTGDKVPDRDLILALTPKKADALAERFKRVRTMIGDNGKKPRYDAIVTISTFVLSEAQQHVEEVFEQFTKRWKLDEVVTNAGKPSVMYYLVRMRKSLSRDALLTAIREKANGSIQSADIEVGDAIATERIERKEQRKVAARR